MRAPSRPLGVTSEHANAAGRTWDGGKAKDRSIARRLEHVSAMALWVTSADAMSAAIPRT